MIKLFNRAPKLSFKFDGERIVLRESPFSKITSWFWRRRLAKIAAKEHELMLRDEENMFFVMNRMASIVHMLEARWGLSPIYIHGKKYKITPVLHTNRPYRPPFELCSLSHSEELCQRFQGIKYKPIFHGPKYAIGFELTEEGTK